METISREFKLVIGVNVARRDKDTEKDMGSLCEEIFKVIRNKVEYLDMNRNIIKVSVTPLVLKTINNDT